MRLTELFAESGVDPDACEGDPNITALSADSRAAKPGSMHVCMPSGRTDTHHYAESAAKAGAIAVLSYSREGYESLRGRFPGTALIEADRYPDALWRIARAFHQQPGMAMKMVGITGTNGKTTTAWLLYQALMKLSGPSVYLGTIGFHLPGAVREAANTTPFPVELFQMLADARDSGAESLVMEVSSHALAERRADGCDFDIGIFTNLTQDHLDFHGTMEAYEQAKWRLFSDLPDESCKPFTAVLNTDDPVGANWASAFQGSLLTYGFESGDVRGRRLQTRLSSLEMAIHYGKDEAVVHAGLGGSFNAWNILSSVAGLVALGYPLANAAEALASAKAAPGRFESVKNHAGIEILVDYAHTPDALEKLLLAAKELTTGRLIAVFGCGGDRDPDKRPKMAAAVSKIADLTIITSDNPRTEDPEKILNQVEKGIAPGAEYKRISDRAEAVAAAIAASQAGDTVVVAGKGHENYQIIGTTKTHMDDRELIRDALGARA
ncbi:MAG: UDP-N-acetylmuramoyl-L-alanyl-D-glutamate--2,6-diaminopimelate ligase [Armatimonadetes bacterium]|nr:UDP-N-acetylmuramoyl-L-alanyl-D-glutamate--2,6-diaminopimelate ligase [Armatimonadota bacterium]